VTLVYKLDRKRSVDSCKTLLTGGSCSPIHLLRFLRLAIACLAAFLIEIPGKWVRPLGTAKLMTVEHFYSIHMKDLSLISRFHLTVKYHSHQPSG
jgi:hypothetical protein